MKITKNASGKYKLTKKAWKEIGKQAGWTKTATKYVVVDSEFNKSHYSDLIGQIVDTPPAYANVVPIESEDAVVEMKHLLARAYTYLQAYASLEKGTDIVPVVWKQQAEKWLEDANKYKGYLR